MEEAQRNIERLKGEVKGLRDNINVLEKEIEQNESLTLVECTKNFPYGKGCGKKSAIKDCVYIQTHWYIEPSGCTDGDYWKQGEGQFICPHCEHINRLVCSPDGRKHIQDLKRLFKEVRDTHDE